MQIGFYIDQTRCTGCSTCIVACKDWHDVPAGPASWLRVKTIEKGRYPDVFVASLPGMCFHCAAPACVEACPAGAISKDAATGIVTVDQEACLGASCGACLEACPYDAPQYRSDVAEMEKCDLCAERWAEGRRPICVEACPLRALDAGPLEELIAKYGYIREAEGFVYAAELGPSVIFKPKRDRQNRPVQVVRTVPLAAGQ